MTTMTTFGVMVTPQADAANYARCVAAVTCQLGDGDRVVAPEGRGPISRLGVDIVAVLSGEAVPGPSWLAALRQCFSDPTVGAATGPVLRFTDGRATNVLVANNLGGALNGAGVWSDVPSLVGSVDLVSVLPTEHYAVRAELVAAGVLSDLATIRGRAEILSACARTGQSVIRSSSVQVEVHAPRSAMGAIRSQLAYDEGYLRMHAARHGAHSTVKSAGDLTRWALWGSRRSPGLLPSLPVWALGEPRRGIASAAVSGRWHALRAT